MCVMAGDDGMRKCITCVEKSAALMIIFLGILMALRKRDIGFRYVCVMGESLERFLCSMYASGVWIFGVSCWFCQFKRVRLDFNTGVIL